MIDLLLTSLLCLSLWLPAQQTSAQNALAETAFKRAVELQQQSQWPEAAEAWRAFLKLEPNHAGAHANLGAVLARLARFDDAVASYETALRLNPQMTQALFNLGVAHFRAGQHARAAVALAQYLQAHSDSWQARQLLGLSLIELGRDEEAVPLLEAALKANAPKVNDDASLLFGLGLAYLRMKRPELKATIESLQTTPDGLPFAYLLTGQNFLAENNFAAAVTVLEAAEKFSSTLPRLYFSLGTAYLRTGRNAEAIKAFERELQLLPRDYWTLYYLAFLFDAESQFAAARDKAQAALALQPRSADANALLGKALLKLGQAAAAIPPLELAVAQNPTETTLRFQLARAYQ